MTESCSDLIEWLWRWSEDFGQHVLDNQHRDYHESSLSLLLTWHIVILFNELSLKWGIGFSWGCCCSKQPPSLALPSVDHNWDLTLAAETGTPRISMELGPPRGFPVPGQTNRWQCLSVYIYVSKNHYICISMYIYIYCVVLCSRSIPSRHVDVSYII